MKNFNNEANSGQPIKEKVTYWIISKD